MHILTINILTKKIVFYIIKYICCIFICYMLIMTLNSCISSSKHEEISEGFRSLMQDYNIEHTNVPTVIELSD